MDNQSQQTAYHADDEEEGGLIVDDVPLRLQTVRATKRSLEKRYSLTHSGTSSHGDTEGTMPSSSSSSSESSGQDNGSLSSLSNNNNNNKNNKRQQTKQQDQSIDDNKNNYLGPGTLFFDSSVDFSKTRTNVFSFPESGVTSNNNNKGGASQGQRRRRSSVESLPSQFLENAFPNDIENLHNSFPANLTFTDDSSNTTGSFNRQKQRLSNIRNNQFKHQNNHFSVFDESSVSTLSSGAGRSPFPFPTNLLLQTTPNRPGQQQQQQEKDKKQKRNNHHLTIQPGAQHVMGPPSLFTTSSASSSSSSHLHKQYAGAHRVVGAPSQDKQHSNGGGVLPPTTLQVQTSQAGAHRVIGGALPKSKIIKQDNNNRQAGAQRVNGAPQDKDGGKQHTITKGNGTTAGAQHVKGMPSQDKQHSKGNGGTTTTTTQVGVQRIPGAPSQDKQHSNGRDTPHLSKQQQAEQEKVREMGLPTNTSLEQQQKDIKLDEKIKKGMLPSHQPPGAYQTKNINPTVNGRTQNRTVSQRERIHKETVKQRGFFNNGTTNNNNNSDMSRRSPAEHVRHVDERIERKRTGFGIGRWFGRNAQPGAYRARIRRGMPHVFVPTIEEHGPSNVTIDDVTSVFTSQTGHSTTTVQVGNTNRHRGRNSATSTYLHQQYGDPSGDDDTVGGNDDVLMPLSVRNGIPLSLEVVNQPCQDMERTSRIRGGRHCISHASLRSMGTFIDDQGRSITVEEMQEIWAQHGLCHRCGQIQTHRKVKYGPCGLWRKLEPLTEEGKSYEGYCLPCHTVPELRVLLNDPNIPLDLPRDEQVDNTRPAIPSRKNLSPLALLLFDVKFQICLGLFGLAAFGGLLATALMLAKSDTGTNTVVPTVAPTANTFPTTSIPTMTPTTQDWKLVTSIIPNDALLEESFGHSLTFDASGDFLAVSAPLAHNKRGQVTVYEIYTIEENNTVSYRPLGQPILGNNEGDLAGLEMTYSLDRFWLAIGYAGEGNGMVRIFELSDSDDEWIQRGQALESPSPMSEFGKTLEFNANGDVVAIGAPGYRNDTGLIQTFVFDGSEWQKLGSDLVGESIGDRFGASASINQDGEFMVVGAPMANSARWKNAGTIYWYEKPNNEVGYQRLGLSRDSEQRFRVNVIRGRQNDNQLGTRVELSNDGSLLFSSSPGINYNGKRGVGVIDFWARNPEYSDLNRLAIPVFGQDSMTGFGSDLAATDHFGAMAVSSRNQPRSIGEARAYYTDDDNFLIPWGSVIDPPPLGNGRWLGLRPSVAIGSDQGRLAVGYQSVLLPNGESKPRIDIYEFPMLVPPK